MSTSKKQFQEILEFKLSVYGLTYVDSILDSTKPRPEARTDLKRNSIDYHYDPLTKHQWREVIAKDQNGKEIRIMALIREGASGKIMVEFTPELKEFGTNKYTDQ